MTIVISTLGLLYEVTPHLEIPGFLILQRNGHFTKALQGKNEFYIDRVENGYRLYPIDALGRCRTDKAITIPV